MNGIQLSLHFTADTPRKFGNYTFGPKDELFVATLGADGSVLLSQDKNGEFYIALQTWCTMKIGLHLIDKSFPDLQCYGGPPVFGKIKFK